MAGGKDDDLFHDIVMSEEISQMQGYTQGLETGRTQGILEGRKLGWEKGAAIGSEVGFYAGFAESLLEEMSKDKEAKPRVIKTLEKLVSLCRCFPLTEAQNPELHTKLEEIRTKFKQMCSLCGIKPGTSTLETTKGISF